MIMTNYKELLLKVLDTIKGEYMEPSHPDSENGPSPDDIGITISDGMILRKYDGSYYITNHYKVNGKPKCWQLQNLFNPNDKSIIEDHDYVTERFLLIFDPEEKQSHLPTLGTIQRILHDYPWLEDCEFKSIDVPEDPDAIYEVTKGKKSLTIIIGADDGVTYVTFQDGSEKTSGWVGKEETMERFKHYFDGED
jgi:hypothetical protein